MSATIDIAVEYPRWQRMRGAEDSIRGAIEATLADCGAEGAEVGVLLTDDARVRELNRTWRGKDAATNVLSFPAPKMGDERSHFLGDIVFALETIEHEATDESKPVSHHVAHLAVHGTLHLLGFDHESDEDAEVMEHRERRILNRLGIPDPYAPAREQAARST
jgi:probable rRNA maturation factor